MKIKRLLLAVLFFSLPLIIRTLWFYRGFSFIGTDVQSPAYESFTITQPTLSTPAAANFQDDPEQAAVILFDQAHRNKYTFAEIETLRNSLIWKGAETISLDVKTDLIGLLKKSDAFVIITPTEFYSDEDIEAIEEFVNRGGRLLVITDPTRSFAEYDTEREKSVILTNEIIAPFQISFRNDYIYNLEENEGNFRNVFVYPSGHSPLEKNISELVFYAAHSLETRSQIVFTGDDKTLSSLDDQGFKLPVASLDTSGNVLVIGDMTFMTTPYDMVLDNTQLILNIADFLVKGQRTKTLDDFPNVFSQDIGIQFFNDLSLDEEILSTIAKIKNSFARDDLSLVILEEPQRGFDMILLGLYPPEGDIREITDELGIVFETQNDGVDLNPEITPTTVNNEEISEQINDGENFQPENGFALDSEGYYKVPGFGNVPISGFGYILLDRRSDHVNLIFLADSQKNVQNLLSLLVSGTLNACLTTQNIAVCEQDAILTQQPTPQDSQLEPLLEEIQGEEFLTPTVEPTGTPVPTDVLTPD